jgi:hypothetical protein
MIELNLLPDDRRKKETVKFLMPEIPIRHTLIWVFATFFGIQALMAVIAVFFAFQMSSIRKETAVLKLEQKDLLAKKHGLAAMKVRYREIQQLATAPLSWTRLLNALTDSMTKGVWLRNVTVVEGETVKGVAPVKGSAPAKGQRTAAAGEGIKQLKIEGSVVAPGQETAFIGKFIQMLKSDPYLTTLFDSVDLSTMNQKKIREYDVFDFTLICSFKRAVLEPSK